MPEERDYLKRAAASLDSIMTRPFEPFGYDRRASRRQRPLNVRDSAGDHPITVHHKEKK